MSTPIYDGLVAEYGLPYDAATVTLYPRMAAVAEQIHRVPGPVFDDRWRVLVEHAEQRDHDAELALAGEQKLTLIQRLRGRHAR